MSIESMVDTKASSPIQRRDPVDNKRTKVSSWRKECIDKFGLQPVPATWKDEVAAATSEDAWKRYYKARSKVEAKRDLAAVDHDEYGDYVNRWQAKLECLKKDLEGGTGTADNWSCTPRIDSMDFEDVDEIRSAHLISYVWSPYAIPRVLILEHRYHNRARYSSYEFHCVWTYQRMDFAEDKNDGAVDEEMEEICSCCFEDQELRAYVIHTPGLTAQSILCLGQFLFGSTSAACKEETCSDYSFLLLLLGSMGTFDYNTFYNPNPMDSEGIGWVWSPRIYLDKKGQNEWLQPMIDDNILRPGKKAARRDTDKFDVCWLEYYVRKASNNLRPIDKYYRDPRKEDAIGYDSDAVDSNDDDEDEDDMESLYLKLKAEGVFS